MSANLDLVVKAIQDNNENEVTRLLQQFPDKLTIAETTRLMDKASSSTYTKFAIIKAVLERRPENFPLEKYLNIACWNFEYELAKFLLEADPSLLNKPDEEGRTPFHIVCANPSAAMITLFIVKGADVNSRTKQGKTPLMCICDNARYARNQPLPIHLLLAKNPESLNATDNSGRTALAYACKTHAPIDSIQALLDAGADPNVGAEGCLPLNGACQAENLDVIKLLLEHNSGNDYNVETLKKVYLRDVDFPRIRGVSVMRSPKSSDIRQLFNDKFKSLNTPTPWHEDEAPAKAPVSKTMNATMPTHESTVAGTAKASNVETAQPLQTQEVAAPASSPFQTWIKRLDAYIDRIDQYPATEKYSKFESSFWVMKKSRGANRKANYELANNLKAAMIERGNCKPEDVPEILAEIFADDNLTKLRPKVAGGNPDRGINSTTLKNIIRDAKKVGEIHKPPKGHKPS